MERVEEGMAYSHACFRECREQMESLVNAYYLLDHSHVKDPDISDTWGQKKKKPSFSQAQKNGKGFLLFKCGCYEGLRPS